MSYWENFSKNIKYLRKQKGFSQEQIADKISITRGSYQYLESKEAKVSILDLLSKICEVYNVTPNELLLYDLQFVEPEKLKEKKESIRQYAEELEKLRVKIIELEDKLKDYL